MRKILENRYISLIARIIVALVFITFGISKIADPIDFAKDIRNYDMLPLVFVNISAIVLPWIELTTGLLILFGIKIKSNAIIIFGLLTVFNIAVATAWARGLNIECGCYSNITEQIVGWKKLAENFGLMILLLLIYFSKNNISFRNNSE